jgi:threonine aldolase
MGNLCAILTHATRGDEAIVSAEAHVVRWEAGGMATIGGIVPRTLPTDDEGRMDPEAVEAAVRADDPHLPRSRLVLVENTYSFRNGSPLPPAYFAAIRGVARRHGMAVHLDGARVFNAAAALGLEVSELARDVDSVSFCLSKGLCAPVGSVLCGSADFIHDARRARKSLGGGMRQAGVLAAAGLVALETTTARLAEDHAHARLLADGLVEIPGILIEPDRIRTNMVQFDLDPSLGLTATGLAERLRDEHGVLIGSRGPLAVRAVTHYWVGEREVGALVEGMRQVVGAA